jgi:hypothetical protein
MTTATQIVERALRLCRVLDASEAVEAGDSQDAIEALNNLGQRWLASGLLPAWTNATGPTFVLVTATSANEALAFGLALKIAPEYGVDLSPLVLEQSKSEIQTLWRDRLTATLAGDTANGLILRALRTLQGIGQLPDTVSFPAALNTLNDMLAEWEGAGFGFAAPVYSALTDALALPSADHEPVSLQLALRLAPEYAIAINEPVQVQAADLLARLVARYSVPNY